MALTTLMLMLVLSLSSSSEAAQTLKDAGPSRQYRIVCYTIDDASHRPLPIRFIPEDVDPRLCTHLVWAFGKLHGSGLFILPPASDYDGNIYRRLTALKTINPDLKVMLSVGGWVVGGQQFTKLVSSVFKMHLFAWGTIAFLRYHKLDGLDIDWEYPGQRGSPPGDKQSFTHLLQILQTAFYHDHLKTSSPRLLLSVAIAPSPYIVGKSYQLPHIADCVDFLNVMTYDLHSPTGKRVGHHSALYLPANDQTESVDFLIQWLLNRSVPSEKISLGLPFYGYSLRLSDPNNSALGAPTEGPATVGPLVGERGAITYIKVCQLLTNRTANTTALKRGRLPGSQAPFFVDDSCWTGYDDESSIKEKVNYTIQKKLGGVSIWTMDMDDFRGLCGETLYPLMQTIMDQFQTQSEHDFSEDSRLSPAQLKPLPHSPAVYLPH